MKVRNVHVRDLPAPADAAGRLIDSLASPNDLLWPGDRWPAMRLDRPLGTEASGGHGPIRYVVESYEPGVNVRFRFTAPAGFDGWHGFDAEATAPHRSRLRHVLEMGVFGRAAVSWSLAFRPLHDALIEDALDRAAVATGGEPVRAGWSLWVRILRRLLRRRRTRDVDAR
jgi:hypothetical protein